MAEHFFPFDAGAGGSITEDQWSKMARLWRTDGVIRGRDNELHVTANGSGMQVFVDLGVAWLHGYYYDTDASITVPIDAPDSQARIDRVVLRLDTTGNTIGIHVNRGTPGTTPVAPPLLAGPVLWDMQLAQVLVDIGAVVIASGKVTDERLYADIDARTLEGQRAAYYATAAGLTSETTSRTAHATATTGVHGVGVSNVESTAGSAAKVTAHEAAGDPHPGYATDGDLSGHASASTGVHGVGGSTVESVAGSASKVATHAAASDPHPGYATDGDVTAEASTRATDDKKRPRFIGVEGGITGTPALSADFQIQAGRQALTTTSGGQWTLNLPASFPNGLLMAQVEQDNVVAVCVLILQPNLCSASQLVGKAFDMAGADLVSSGIEVAYMAIGW